MAQPVRWTVDDEGNEVMPPLWERYLEWLLSDPRLPKTYEELAKALDCHRDTFKRIRRDKRFIAVWERKAAEKNVSVDRVQGVVDALHRQALEGDVKAASLYLQYVDRFLPKKQILVEQHEVVTMTDADLAAELEQHVAALRGTPPALDVGSRESA